MFVLLIIFDAGEVLSVLALLNDATPAFFCLVCLALILLAMSIGLVQVAGSATTLPFLGPDVHLNLRCSVPLAPRPSTLPTASVIGSHGYSS